MSSGESKNSAMHIVEDIVGCKWSLRVINAVRNGHMRPGEMKRDIAGISEKVLSERLKKLTRYELLIRKAYPETPPRVEYRFSEKGKRFLKVLDAIERFADV